MKKNFLLIAIIAFVVSFGTTLYAETGLEALQICSNAMKLDKLDSFKTMHFKAYIYAQNQKISVNFWNKDYGDGVNKLRFEQSTLGKEEGFVITDDEFFRVKPEFEMLDKDNAHEVMQIYSMAMPSMIIAGALADSTATIELVGTEEYNKKKCKKVSLKPKKTPDDMKDLVQYIYLDETTNWFVGTTTVMGPDKESGITLDGMKKTKGFVYPTTVKILANGKKQLEIEIDKLEADIDIDDALFAKP